MHTYIYTYNNKMHTHIQTKPTLQGSMWLRCWLVNVLNAECELHIPYSACEKTVDKCDYVCKHTYAVVPPIKTFIECLFSTNATVPPHLNTLPPRVSVPCRPAAFALSGSLRMINRLLAMKIARRSCAECQLALLYFALSLSFGQFSLLMQREYLTFYLFYIPSQ